MTFDIVTIFPAMIERALEDGVVGRAIERGTLEVTVHDLRVYTTDRHRVVDDIPYGGGPGMVMKPEPLFRALEALEAIRTRKGHESAGSPVSSGGPGSSASNDPPAAGRRRVILTSPQGRRFTQDVATELSRDGHLVLLCGRYEGIDERVRARVDDEISIGDYVLSGGELAALVIVDAVARLIPGVVGDQQSVIEESFSRGLLDFPHYTRPADLTRPGVAAGGGGATENGDAALKVPAVLLSGNHAAIRRWRKREAIVRTLVRRPDLLTGAALDDEEQELLREIVAQRDKGDEHGRH
jgi:tRNA (guanine37-N1)-methyltransferase